MYIIEPAADGVMIFRSYTAKSGKHKDKAVVWVCTVIRHPINVSKDTDYYRSHTRIGRGVAVCSPLDEPTETEGKAYAARYALRAVKDRPNIPIDVDAARDMIMRTDCPHILHSDRAPVLSFQEIKALKSKRAALDTAISCSYLNECPTVRVF